MYTESVGFGIARTKSTVITVTNSWPINYFNVTKGMTTKRKKNKIKQKQY